MTATLVVYWLSLGVLIGAAVLVLLHPRTETGVIGSFLLGGIAMFALTGYDQPAPNWLVGLVACEAGLCLYVLARAARGA